MITSSNHRPLAATLTPTVAAAAALLFISSAPTAHAAPSFASSDEACTATSSFYSRGSQFRLSVTFTTDILCMSYTLRFDTARAAAPQLSIVDSTLTNITFPNYISGDGSQAFNTADIGRSGFLSNPNDLGAVVDANSPVATSSYQVENVALLIGNLALGTSTLQPTPAARRAGFGEAVTRASTSQRRPAPSKPSPPCQSP